MGLTFRQLWSHFKPPLPIYLSLGVLVWLAFLKSGVHATIAGVLLALVIPSSKGVHIEKALHRWVSFGIMPLFALANAGVSFSGGMISHSVSMGIIGGLVFGKQIGVTLFSWLAVRFGLAILPERVRWSQLYGIGWLGGIGFTMSLFIANLAFGDTQLVDVAKLGILAASLASGVIGAIILYRTRLTR